jgi:hypothetical protein
VGDTWNLGERIDDYGFGLRHKKTTAPNFRGKLFGFKPDSQTLDMADPGFQRQMNQLFLLDTLAAHTDRHAGNFNISVDAANAIHVHAIDNDLTFGTLGGDEEHAAEFGKRGYSANYGGLPTKMQIDADTAKKIEKMTRQQLDLTFSDLLSKKEIDALWFRFQMLKKYIEDMREEGLIVDKWDKKTARREVQLAGGLGSHLNEVDDEVGGGYAGNNYYQRQMLMLNALDIDTTHERREGLLQAAAYGYRKDRPSKA